MQIQSPRKDQPGKAIGAPTPQKNSNPNSNLQFQLKMTILSERQTTKNTGAESHSHLHGGHRFAWFYLSLNQRVKLTLHNSRNQHSVVWSRVLDHWTATNFDHHMSVYQLGDKPRRNKCIYNSQSNSLTCLLSLVGPVPLKLHKGAFNRRRRFKEDVHCAASVCVSGQVFLCRFTMGVHDIMTVRSYVMTC